MSLYGGSFELAGIVFENGRKFERNGLEFEVFQAKWDYSWGFKWTDGKQCFHSVVLRGTPEPREIDESMENLVKANLSDIEREVRRYLDEATA